MPDALVHLAAPWSWMGTSSSAGNPRCVFGAPGLLETPTIRPLYPSHRVAESPGRETTAILRGQQRVQGHEGVVGRAHPLDHVGQRVGIQSRAVLRVGP